MDDLAPSRSRALSHRHRLVTSMVFSAMSSGAGALAMLRPSKDTEPGQIARTMQPPAPALFSEEAGEKLDKKVRAAFRPMC